MAHGLNPCAGRLPDPSNGRLAPGVQAASGYALHGLNTGQASGHITSYKTGHFYLLPTPSASRTTFHGLGSSG